MSKPRNTTNPRWRSLGAAAKSDGDTHNPGPDTFNTPPSRIDFQRQMFEDTRNPIYVWDAIGVALRAGLPLPLWVNAYLLTTANRFHPLSRTGIPGEIAPAVAVAVGFEVGKGKRNPFRHGHEQAHGIMLACAVYDEETNDFWTHQNASKKMPRERVAASAAKTARTLPQLFKAAAVAHASTCDECRRVPSVATMKAAWDRHKEHLFFMRTKRDNVWRGRRLAE